MNKEQYENLEKRGIRVRTPDTVNREKLEIEDMDLLTKDPFELTKTVCDDEKLIESVAGFIKREQDKYKKATAGEEKIPESVTKIFIKQIKRILENPNLYSRYKE